MTTYGYPVFLAGTLLEGETTMVLDGVAAYMGYLSLEWVVACGFTGSVTGDQLYFFLGRRHGKALLARRPVWQAGTERILHKLKGHQDLLILGFRLLFGLPSVFPFAIGVSGISWLRYTFLNAVGAGIWATVVGLAGYYLGQAVGAVFGDVRHYEFEIMGGIITVAALLWIVHSWRRRHSLRLG